jgi:lipopolysaccharide/colanic/teichoic acid biosynthesis glycosyltransferase
LGFENGPAQSRPVNSTARNCFDAFRSSLQLKMKNQKIRFAILLADLLWVLGAFGLAIGLRYTGAPAGVELASHFEIFALMVLAAVVAWIPLYFELNLDGFKGGWHFPAILSKLIVAVSLLMVFVLAFAFLIRHGYSRLVLLYFPIFFLLGLIAERCLVRLLVSSQLRNTADHRCVILGNGRIGRELASKIAAHPELHFQVVGFLLPGDSEMSNGFASSPKPAVTCVKTLQVLEFLAEQQVKKLIVAIPEPNGAGIRKLIAECRAAGIKVYLVPQLYDLYISETELVEIDGLPLLSLQERDCPAVNFALKRALDFVLSLGILLFVSPLLALAALVVYGKKGTAFRTELRCGKDGIPFRMWRLNIERYTPSESGYEKSFVRWSLTELPQLWNVLRGDMSLVGPRPESPERVKYYSDWQRQRLKVVAGVTGLAQVHGLRDQHSSEDKTRYDLQYIFNWSPFLDLSLILQTVWTLLSRGLNQVPVTSETATSLESGTGSFVRQEVADVNRS